MNNLALLAGRKRQSPQTGFIHHCYEDANSRDTIPLFENFCFALALFRTHIVEHVLEGKALLEKLLPFQVGDNFPVYLHEYPTCRHPYLGEKIYPIFHWIQKEFPHQKLPPLPNPQTSSSPKTPEEWADLLLLCQIKGAPIPEVPYNLYSFLGSQKQDKLEPAVTLFDLYMGALYGTFSSRALQDHPVHLKASLIRPFAEQRPLSTDTFVATPQGYFWGDAKHTHSCVLETKGKLQEGIFHLPETFAPDDIEIAFYCDAHPDNNILVNGKKATTFQLGDTITIGKALSLQFNRAGEGDFFGHIHPGNRPSQLAPHKFEAYDWKIALRTLRRPTASAIGVRKLMGGMSFL